MPDLLVACMQVEQDLVVAVAACTCAAAAAHLQAAVVGELLRPLPPALAALQAAADAPRDRSVPGSLLLPRPSCSCAGCAQRLQAPHAQPLSWKYLEQSQNAGSGSWHRGRWRYSRRVLCRSPKALHLSFYASLLGSVALQSMEVLPNLPDQWLFACCGRHGSGAGDLAVDHAT